MIVAASSRQRVFVVWWSELDRWVVPASVLMGGQLPTGWTTAKIGELVQLVTDRVEADADREYKMAGVKWYGQGVFHRETVRGDKMSAKYVAPLKPGAVIYNRLFAWKASFAVVPGDLSDCHVSNEFPQFFPDPSKLLPEYLYLWTVTEQTIRAVNAASTGSAAVSRNRFREEFFLEFGMPLPPLPVQRAIVSEWEQAQAEIADIHLRIAGLEDKIETDFLTALGLPKPKRAMLPKVFAAWWKDLERWSVMFNQLASVSVDFTTGKYPLALLGDVAAVSYGIQKCPANRPAQHARPYLRVANVQRGELDLHEVKKINVHDAEMPTYRLEPGDLLFVEGNGSRNELGRCAIWHGEISDCVHQNHILKVRPDQARVLTDYAMTWFNTEAGKDHFFRSVKTSSGLGTINSSELRAAPIPLPPPSVQRVLVANVTAQRQRIAALKAEAERKAVQAKVDVESRIRGEKQIVA